MSKKFLFVILMVTLCSQGYLVWMIQKFEPAQYNFKTEYTIAQRKYTMRVTGYVAKGKGAIGNPVRPGHTAAVSPKCLEILGKTVYVEGHGIWHVEDRASPTLDDKHRICTLDIAKPTQGEAMAVGSKENVVIVIN